ncbi:MAG: dCTP deaminase [Chloroflexi bacterium]|nr:dCTP deaminase [Chloroflexota bacterium]
MKEENEISERKYMGGSPSQEELRSRIFAADIRKRLVITPLIDIHSRLQKNTITLSIGTKFIIMRTTRYAVIDPLNVDCDAVEDILEKVELEFNEDIVLRPGQMILAGSFEYISLPDDICAQVGSRSTYGRLALVPATATFVHSGFKGCLTLELVNVGTDPIVICPKMEVAQLVLQYCNPDSCSLDTRYKLPVGPEFPKVWADKNLKKLKKFRTSIAFKIHT